jgi:hypothetical protein
LEDESMAKPQENLDLIYTEIADAFDLKGKTRDKLKVDIELIAEAGFYAAAADPSQICDKDIFNDKVVFASANFQCVKRLVNTPAKRQILEKIIDDNGFEHLATVRFINHKLMWEDFC